MSAQQVKGTMSAQQVKGTIERTPVESGLPVCGSQQMGQWKSQGVEKLFFTMMNRFRNSVDYL